MVSCVRCAPGGPKPEGRPLWGCNTSSAGVSPPVLFSEDLCIFFTFSCCQKFVPNWKPPKCFFFCDFFNFLVFARRFFLVFAHWGASSVQVHPKTLIDCLLGCLYPSPLPPHVLMTPALPILPSLSPFLPPTYPQILTPKF